MSQISNEDLSTMINLKEFGEEIVYTPKNSAPITISALYQEPMASSDVGLEVNPIANLPSIIVRLIDIDFKIYPRDNVIIRGQNFKVEDFVDDKLGTIEIFLHRAI